MSSRRNFIKSSTFSLPLILSGSTIFSCGLPILNKVDNISLYLINVNTKRHFSHGSWNNRQHIIIEIKSGNFSGWGETKVSNNQPDFDIYKWIDNFSFIKDLGIQNAINNIRKSFFNSQISARVSEGVLIALYDLLGKINKKPTIEMWNLEGRDPVPALFCILERDTSMVLEKAKIAKEQNMHRYVKLKMFGELETDLKNLIALRGFLGPNSFIIGDANSGYKNIKNLDELVTILNTLNRAGMNSIEDPGLHTKEDWEYLNKNVINMSLVPDKILRPAKESLKFYSKEMGKIFNIHPHVQGSFIESNQLAKMIIDSERKLMIGDGSLIGAACTFWQQFAVGNKAFFVEAMEKPQEDSTFLNCIIEKSTSLNSEGKVVLNLKPGFGLKVNSEKLKKDCSSYHSI